MIWKDRGPRGRKLVCSFCGKNECEIKNLIAGPKVYICDECIELGNGIIAQEHEREELAKGPEDLGAG